MTSLFRYFHIQVNGINLKQVPAKDAYAYARNILDVLFTKEELSKSVLLKTKKSEKPPLSPGRVQTLFGESTFK